MVNKHLVIITGASSGIGASTAKLFSSHGHPLLLIARRVEKLEALKLSDTICSKVDVRDYNALKSAIAEAESHFGDADALINNAGIMLLGDIAVQDPNEWKKMFDINILGLLNGMQAVLSNMVKRQHGTIVNIGSMAGKKSFPNHAAYCGTKFGVHAISESVREEVANHNVRVVTIAPGAVETELLGHTTSNDIKEGYESWKKEIGGAIGPEQVADAIWYAYNQPQSLNIREIVLAPTKQQP